MTAEQPRPPQGPEVETEPDAWSTDRYAGDGLDAGFERVVFFSDAVFAIALTLMAVEIGTPETEDGSSPAALWSAVVAKGPALAAYAIAFFWVAIYWRANHRFTATLRAMSGRYIAATLVYLALIALLPFPASTLGEYPNNAVSVALFAVFAATVSTMEIVLLVIAHRDDLFRRPFVPGELRYRVLGSLTPIPGFLISIPVAFASPTAGVLCWFLGSIAFGWIVGSKLGNPAAASPN